MGPKTGSGVRDSPCSHCSESHKKSTLYNCNIYAEGLGQFYEGSLVVASVTLSPYEPKGVGSVGF